jgi:hypothetical protein
MHNYVYDRNALQILYKNKEKLQITEDLARKILLELYPGKYPCLTKDLEMLSTTRVYALKCIEETQKSQLCNLIEWLGWRLMPDWAWTPPSKTQRRSTIDLTGLLSQLLAMSNTKSPSPLNHAPHLV